MGSDTYTAHLPKLVEQGQIPVAVIDEVVELYIHQRGGSASRPLRELRGFDRVTLAPGEKRTVRFNLSPDELRFWSTAERRWVQEAPDFDVWAGADSGASLHAALKVIE